MGVKIQKLRDSARGQECTFRLTAICCRDPEKTVLCHAPDELRGKGTKTDDWNSAYGCFECHQEMDLHRLTPYEEAKTWLRAIRRTQRIWYELGLMSFPETPKRQAVIPKIVPRPDGIRRC